MRRLRRAAVKLYRNCIYIRAMQMRTAACALKIHLCECLCGKGGDVGGESGAIDISCCCCCRCLECCV